MTSRTYSNEQIKLQVWIPESNVPILNVFLEDGTWFPLRADEVRCPKDSKVHPKVYERIWGKPMPQDPSSGEKTQ